MNWVENVHGILCRLTVTVVARGQINLLIKMCMYFIFPSRTVIYSMVNTYIQLNMHRHQSHFTLPLTTMTSKVTLLYLNIHTTHSLGQDYLISDYRVRYTSTNCLLLNIPQLTAYCSTYP